MLAGLCVIVTGLVVVALIANSGRISANTGTDLTKSGFATQKRNACLTDLRNESDFFRNEVIAAVLNRLAVLDGVNPETGEPLPKILNEDNVLVVDPDTQGEMAEEYVRDGIVARNEALKSAKKLLQPELNKLCGEPITEKTVLDKTPQN